MNEIRDKNRAIPRSAKDALFIKSSLFHRRRIPAIPQPLVADVRWLSLGAEGAAGGV